MKRFTTLLATAAFALLLPTVVSAQAPYVYRPELRAWVFVPKPAPGVFAPRTAAQTMVRHEAMANGLRGTRMAQAAVHCDRMVKEAREELRRQF
jgi:hypothetical protein